MTPGDVIAEIETDKATMELESSEEGFFAKKMVEDGASDIALGTVRFHLPLQFLLCFLLVFFLLFCFLLCFSL